jgi:hypothetical protein
MNFKIKEDHPIVQFILEEVENSWERFKNNIGICTPIIITERPIVSSDIYGFKFNGNNWDVRVINIAYFNGPKVENASKILNTDINGYDQYTYSCNTCIKLKTFLERNPQWSQNMDEWMIPIIEDKKSAKYYGHNTDRQASIRLPNDKSVIVKMPDDLTQSDFLDWVHSEAEKITIQYYREEALNEVLNIKRDRSVYVNGIWFKYDYIDGLVEIFDIRIGSEIFSQYKNLMSLFELKSESYTEIKKEIESGDLEVKEIKFKI